jgi:CubicO group peptidase (beta-lactamase class C family)
MRSLARIAVSLIAGCGLVAGCSRGPTDEELAAVRYAPEAVAGWTLSTPEEHGLDPDAVAELYWRAGQLETIRSLLVVKGGELVAAGYFHDGSPTYRQMVASVTKSFTGALVGIAIDRGCLAGVDEPMMTYFPELADQVQDRRKNSITIRQLLQFRAGYPWEESSEEGMAWLYGRFRPSDLIPAPLVRDPGSGWDYSSFSSHLLAVIVARACDADLMDFATEHLFGPLGITPGDWITDREGYRNGHGDLELSALDMARFGQLYLDGGRFQGQQVVPESWIADSWQPYTEDAWYHEVGGNFGRTAYGYQWWIIDAGPHTYDLAWGHGGQQIAVLPELDMVVVVTADPLFGDHSGGGWSLEKANLNVVADFIAGLPAS